MWRNGPPGEIRGSGFVIFLFGKGNAHRAVSDAEVDMVYAREIGSAALPHKAVKV
jgi:hypothetical protein